MDYKEKYLKYKLKYLNVVGGDNSLPLATNNFVGGGEEGVAPVEEVQEEQVGPDFTALPDKFNPISEDGIELINDRFLKLCQLCFQDENKNIPDLAGMITLLVVHMNYCEGLLDELYKDIKSEGSESTESFNAKKEILNNTKTVVIKHMKDTLNKFIMQGKEKKEIELKELAANTETLIASLQTITNLSTVKLDINETFNKISKVIEYLTNILALLYSFLFIICVIPDKIKIDKDNTIFTTVKAEFDELTAQNKDIGVKAEFPTDIEKVKDASKKFKEKIENIYTKHKMDPYKFNTTESIELQLEAKQQTLTEKDNNATLDNIIDNNLFLLKFNILSLFHHVSVDENDIVNAEWTSYRPIDSIITFTKLMLTDDTTKYDLPSKTNFYDLPSKTKFKFDNFEDSLDDLLKSITNNSLQDKLLLDLTIKFLNKNLNNQNQDKNVSDLLKAILSLTPANLDDSNKANELYDSIEATILARHAVFLKFFEEEKDYQPIKNFAQILAKCNKPLIGKESEETYSINEGDDAAINISNYANEAIALKVAQDKAPAPPAPPAEPDAVEDQAKPDEDAQNMVKEVQDTLKELKAERTRIEKLEQNSNEQKGAYEELQKKHGDLKTKIAGNIEAVSAMQATDAVNNATKQLEEFDKQLITEIQLGYEYVPVLPIDGAGS